MQEYDENLGMTIGEELLKPTRIYVKGILELLQHFSIKGVSHITGGGFYENIPRMLPEGLSAEILRDSWPVLPVFSLIQKAGNITEHDMYNTFNMGIGMVLACESVQEHEIIACLRDTGYQAYQIGSIIEGQEGVVLR